MINLDFNKMTVKELEKINKVLSVGFVIQDGKIKGAEHESERKNRR